MLHFRHVVHYKAFSSYIISIADNLYALSVVNAIQLSIHVYEMVSMGWI